MAIETPKWTYKSKGDKQTASEMNELAQAVIANAIELSNIKDDIANLSDDVTSFLEKTYETTAVVVDVETYESLPTVGSIGKIYVTTDTNIAYRWTGTTYVEISKSIALGETSSTAYRGDLGAIAYAHSQIAGGTGAHVSSTERTNWNLAYTNNHAHANKSLIDDFSQSDNDVLDHLSVVNGKLKVDIDLRSGWFRSGGTTGWINDTYGGGIYMTDTTYVKVYNNKAFWVDNGIIALGGESRFSWGSTFTDPDDSSDYRDWETDRKSTRLNSSHSAKSRMPSSA